MLLPAGAAYAIQFDLPLPFGEQSLSGTLNTTMTAGAEWRVQTPSKSQIGKANLDPNVCGGQFQSCQGLFKDQSFPAAHLFAATGAASPTFDDGDLNFKKWDVTQALGKVTQDLTLTWGDFGFFAKGLFFYDGINNDFDEFHPNRITPDNVNQVGCTTTVQQGGCNATGVGPAGGIGVATFPRTFGPGGVVKNRRVNGESLERVGTAFQLFDLNFYGSLPIGDHELSFKLGRQTLNWGESTLLIPNSINTINPLNVNNLNRVGFDLPELFIPTGMASLSFDPFTNATLSGFYGYEWQPFDIPPPGSFKSFVDIGFPDINTEGLSLSFGGAAEDPQGVGFPANNPLAGITNTALNAIRLPDNTAPNQGQYGASFKYYFENFNNGTEVGFYFANYHSQVPFISTYAVFPSCARAEGNPDGIDATDPVSFLQACPDLPFVNGSDPGAATSNALALDTLRFQFDYPKNIKLYGMSFNTTFGDWSVQGEVSYRPQAPVQVDGEDLYFASFGPTLSRCGEPGHDCAGSHPGTGFAEDGSSTTFNSSDVDPAHPDTFDLGIGHADGSARSFPSFIIPFRGGQLGENQACFPEPGSAEEAKFGFDQFEHPFFPFNNRSPCYIRGFQNFSMEQFNIGATRVFGSTENPLGADQMIWLVEWGANHTNLPPLSKFIPETIGTFFNAGAGADGSGADGSRQACSTNQASNCVVGPDGLRFNPHQQDLGDYADSFSWGYRIINLTRFESVFPGVGFEFRTIFFHDVAGTTPGAGGVGPFVAGRKELILNWETRYKSALAFDVGYHVYTGGGDENFFRDRDSVYTFIKYQF